MSKMKMSKKKTKSEATVKSELQIPAPVYMPPSDRLIVKIMSLRLSTDDSKHFAIKVTFFDQLILHAIIKSIGARDEEQTNSIANGSIDYDPSDYEKMCLFADCPLIVHIQPLRNINQSTALSVNKPQGTLSQMQSQTAHAQKSQSHVSQSEIIKHASNISCCNVDILSLFLGEGDKQKVCIKKRMEPMVQPSLKNRKSWDTLPLLTMELCIERDPENVEHHRVLKDANWMKLTLVACYNMYIPYENDYLYTAATKTPLYSSHVVDGLITFDQGYREPRRFDCTNFYPKWESLRIGGDLFTRSDQKLQCGLEDIQNHDNIDLPYYLTRILPYHTAVWGSFHRTLMLKNADTWLWNRLRNYRWPLEIHIYGENGGYSFMAFLNLFQLLYPGEHVVRLAVPLQWINAAAMRRRCGCDLLLPPNDKAPSITNEKTPAPTPTAQKSKSSKMTTESVGTSVTTLTAGHMKATGADGNDAFVVVEIKLGRPLKKAASPPRILEDEISVMLMKMENSGPRKRICAGRGQQEKDWHKTVRSAVKSLRKVPYYGPTEFCTFNRQLSETRTRVELMTSCWQDAAIYINNNFVVQQYLHSDEVFEELVMMSHACLMRSAQNMLLGGDERLEIDPTLRAARHARQMLDTRHAMELYMQVVVEKPRNANSWRELSTCLKDIDRDWATTCLNKAVVLDPRHPLTLVSKGAMLFEENPTAAEPFFMALLEFFPNWTTIWTIASVYFYERELFHVADLIMSYANKYRSERSPEEWSYSRTWEQELGDWWDYTPLLPNMSLYFDAADFLLRLRAVPTNYIRVLEAECKHSLGNVSEAIASFEKAGSCVSGFSVLMSLACGDIQRARTILLDLVRRQPSAYAWTALAEDWVMRSNAKEFKDEITGITYESGAARSCAVACATQALKIDRRAGRAWALLGKLVQPTARRLHCFNMANLCGWAMTDDEIHNVSIHQHMACHQVGTALRECRCTLCNNTRV